MKSSLNRKSLFALHAGNKIVEVSLAYTCHLRGYHIVGMDRSHVFNALRKLYSDFFSYDRPSSCSEYLCKYTKLYVVFNLYLVIKQIITIYIIFSKYNSKNQQP
jgi:hypothetical protein